MEQFLSGTCVQVRNRRVEIQAVPIAEHGIALFAFSVRQTPNSSNSNPACISFCFPQASLLEESPRLQTIARMLSCVWGRTARPLSIETLQRRLSNFYHQTIQQRDGLGVGFFTHLFFPTTRTQQQRTDATVRGEVTDGELVFTAASNNNEERETNRERGLETAIAKVERVDGVGVGEEDCCSICFEELKVTMDLLDLARTPCQHVFHYDCIGRWLESSQTCPLCRCEMQHDSLLYFHVSLLQHLGQAQLEEISEDSQGEGGETGSDETQMRRDRGPDRHT